MPENAAETKTSEMGTDGARNVSRRSPRVRFQIPIFIYSEGEGNQPIYAEAHTFEVSAHGGLLVTTRAAKIGESILLIQPKSEEKMVCQVRFTQQVEQGMHHVGVEFTTPSPRFWGIGFPADDRNPDEHKLPQAAVQATSIALAAGPRKAPSRTSTERRAEKATGQSAQHDAKGIGREKIDKFGRDRWRVLAWAGSALAIVLALRIFWTTRSPNTSNAASEAAGTSVVEGVASEDARLIPNLGSFRLAAERDFDPLAVSWLRGLGQQPSGDIVGRYSGSSQSHAYVLIGTDHQRRVVIVAGGQIRCDAEYRTIAIAALVPEELLRSISWDDASPIESEGDGLLVVRSVSDPGSGVVLLLSGDQVVPRVLVDFHQVPIRQAP